MTIDMLAYEGGRLFIIQVKQQDHYGQVSLKIEKTSSKTGYLWQVNDGSVRLLLRQLVIR